MESTLKNNLAMAASYLQASREFKPSKVEKLPEEHLFVASWTLTKDVKALFNLPESVTMLTVTVDYSTRPIKTLISYENHP